MTGAEDLTSRSTELPSLVSIETVDNHIADVRLNRPEKYNALSPEMFNDLVAAGESLMERNDIRAVVLSGQGPGFCAGLDMNSFQGMVDRAGSNERPERNVTNENAPEPNPDRPENHAQRAAYVWKKLPVPVIAALHGVAYGGGCQIALAADIRFAAPEAKMSVLEIKWGIIPDMSLTQTLRDLVGMDVAKELTFTGRVLSAQQAHELGMITHVTDDPLAAAFELAKEIAGKSPDAVRAGKKLFETSWHADERIGLKLEPALQSRLIGSPNQVEAVMANFENRAPDFSDAS